jgi:hypothetical protein
MLIIFCEIKGIVHKEFILAGQRVISPYVFDVSRRLRENVRRFRLELWRPKNWLLNHENTPSHTSFISHEVWQKYHDCLPPKLLSSVYPIEDKSVRPPS